MVSASKTEDDRSANKTILRSNINIMYILNEDGSESINSTSIVSFKIEKMQFSSEEMRVKYPEAHAVVAYGKGDKKYLLGVYVDESMAKINLKWMHDAMDENKKTYRF